MESTLASFLEPPQLPENMPQQLKVVLEDWFARMAAFLQARSVGDQAQDLQGDGVIDLETLTTMWSTVAPSAATLADGYESQVKIIALTLDGGDGVVTPDNFGPGTTVTLNDAGDSVTLQFLKGQWWVLSNNGAVIA